MDRHEVPDVKPGKGPAFVRTTIKNVLSGKIVDKTFNAGMKMEFETVDNRTLQYSYEDGDNFVFMDMTTYDQIMVPKTLLATRPSSCSKAPTAWSPSTTHPAEHRSAGLRGPDHHPHRAGPAGNRSNAGTKPATVETGAEIQVPLFINEGDRVKINTEDGSYTGRENN